MIISPFLGAILYTLLCIMAVIIGVPLLFFKKTKRKAITLILISFISFPVLIIVYILMSVLLFLPIKGIVDLLFSRELDQLIWWVILLYHLAIAGTYSRYSLMPLVCKLPTHLACNEEMKYQKYEL